MITGMSYGALSLNAKVALARGASAVGSSTTSGDGGMLPAEREHTHDDDRRGPAQPLRRERPSPAAADAIELTIGQGAKPGTGGLLLGSKVSPGDRRASATCRRASTSARPARHPDFLGPDDMIIKIEELREATDWRVPIFVKIGATRVFDDVKLAAKCGADVDRRRRHGGRHGGLARDPPGPHGHPDAGRDRRGAARARGHRASYGEVQLIAAGGIRSGVDVAKALALGADACYIGTAALIALNCNAPLYLEDYAALGTAPGACHHCHTGRCPVGITTQDPDLMARLPIDEAAERVANFLTAMTLEVQMIARACGKANVHDLDPDDLRALTIEAAAITADPARRHGLGPRRGRSEASIRDVVPAALSGLRPA